MRVTQISVFLENRPGRLAYLLQVLADTQINMRALSVADSADFGIVRMIVDDVDQALQAIHAANLTAATTQVLRVEIPDTPGGLDRQVVEPLAESGVNIEYMYAYGGRISETAIVVLKVDHLDKAIQALSNAMQAMASS
ncbi:MAG: ACT domain-containing protein [Proteobacteria bacterium]|nr:ACT domain-containing protein [Pseudomonadota bacterium]